MQQLLIKYLGSIIRIGLAAIIGWAGAEGAIADSDLAAAASVVTLIAWGIWEKTQARKEKLTGHAMVGPTSEAAVKAKVKAGAAPSLTTPQDAVPELRG